MLAQLIWGPTALSSCFHKGFSLGSARKSSEYFYVGSGTAFQELPGKLSELPELRLDLTRIALLFIVKGPTFCTIVGCPTRKHPNFSQKFRQPGRLQNYANRKNTQNRQQEVGDRSILLLIPNSTITRKCRVQAPQSLTDHTRSQWAGGFLVRTQGHWPPQSCDARLPCQKPLPHRAMALRRNLREYRRRMTGHPRGAHVVPFPAVLEENCCQFIHAGVLRIGQHFLTGIATTAYHALALGRYDPGSRRIEMAAPDHTKQHMRHVFAKPVKVELIEYFRPCPQVGEREGDPANEVNRSMAQMFKSGVAVCDVRDKTYRLCKTLFHLFFPWSLPCMTYCICPSSISACEMLCITICIYGHFQRIQPGLHVMVNLPM